MVLARRPFTQGNRLAYNIDYSAWLTPAGTTLAAASVSTADPGFAIDTITHTATMVKFYLSGNSAVNEIFTVAVQVTDSNSEIKNDTIEFFVVAP